MTLRYLALSSDPRTPALSRAPHGGRAPQVMPPKPKAKPGGGAPIERAAAAATQPAPLPDAYNGQLLSDVQAAISEITGHEAFVGMEQLPPTATGSRQPFTVAACEAGLKSPERKYCCAINMWSFNLARLNTPGVPILRSSIDALMEHYFQRPMNIPSAAGCSVVTCTATAAAAAGEINVRGLVASSPPEILFAFLFAVARDLKKGDDELLKQWREAMLACPTDFYLALTDESRHKVALQHREDIAENYARMRYNSVQKMFDVKRTFDEMSKAGNPTIEAVSAYYATVRWSSMSEDGISTEFVKCAIAVLQKMMINPACERVVLKLAEAGSSNPLDSIYKLHKIVVRCAGSVDDMAWSLELMYDLWHSGALAGDQFAIRLLQTAGKSLTDLMLFKKDILDFLLNKFMDSRSFKIEGKKVLRDTCRDLEYFRRQCGYFYNAKYKEALSLVSAVVHTCFGFQ